jgi:beta-lactam-binding protein with PASTA domain
MVQVPALVGVAADEARARLRAASLRADRTEARYSDRYPAGIVLQTTPPAGTRVRPQTDVTLGVVQGRATCANCGQAREGGARFCTGCGRPYSDQ